MRHGNESGKPSLRCGVWKAHDEPVQMLGQLSWVLVFKVLMVSPGLPGNKHILNVRLHTLELDEGLKAYLPFVNHPILDYI